MRSSNPALNENIFVGQAEDSEFLRTRNLSNVMTMNGTVLKTGLLLFLVIGAASLTWVKFWTPIIAGETPSVPQGLMLALPFAGIAGFIVGLITVFFPKVSPITAPIYAICQGVFLGAISAFLNTRFPGIVAQAVLLTFGTFALMLTAYVARVIRATEKFRTGVIIATGGIMLCYLATFVLGLFGVQVPYIHESGIIGIGFSIFVVIVAALNLILDFDFVERSTQLGLPKYMEWYAGYGLLVTLIWLYIEFLRLLTKLRGRE